MIKKTRDTVTSNINRIKQDLRGVPRQALAFWIKTTPKDTGNARSKTKLQGSTIVADYDYAQRLDQGYSKKAPRGMSEPTTKFIESKVRRIMR